MATIFTKIINREIPASIVYENDKVLAFKDINPQAPIHILVIPKKEIPTINDIKEEDRELIGEMYLAIAKIAKDLGIAEEGYELSQTVMNMVDKRFSIFTSIYLVVKKWELLYKIKEKRGLKASL